MSGSDFMMGKFANGPPAKKRAPVNLAAPVGVTPAQLDDVENLLDRAGDDGKKFAAGLKSAASALDRLAECGLTPDALVLLVTEKAPWPKSSKHKLSSVQIEAALKGLFAIGEFLR